MAATLGSLGTSGATARAAAVQDDALPCGLTTPGRVVAIGDVHGAFDRYVAILQAAGLIDERRRWSGGDAHLVQLGDAIDRGDASRRVLDLLRDLERQARRGGGRVHYLLGNHEVMRMQADLRYVGAADYEAFREPTSEGLRDRAYQIVVERARAAARQADEAFDERAFRADFMRDTPLGLIEMQMAFGADGEYGRWLRQHDAIAVINGTVFVHGGVSPDAARRGCAGIASTARAELREDRIADPAREALLLDSEAGPLWYRGLVDGTATAADVAGVLDALGATRMVVGHTATEGRRITPSFDGRLYAIDTGMLGGEWYAGGVPSALEIDGDLVTAIYLDGRQVLAGGAPGVRDR